MKVINSERVPAITNSTGLFTAPVTLQFPFTEGESKYNIVYVHFPDGVRNKFHRHTNDQILIVTEGKGKIANQEKEIEIQMGDIVLIPAGEIHWHGAVSGSAMTHISIMQTGATLEQLEK